MPGACWASREAVVARSEERRLEFWKRLQSREEADGEGEGGGWSLLVGCQVGGSSPSFNHHDGDGDGDDKDKDNDKRRKLRRN